MANNNSGGIDRNGIQGNGTSRRGFASMDQQKQREIASKGGKASAEGDTSNRGFASMDGEKQRQIASVGGKASGASRRNNAMRNRLGTQGDPDRSPSQNDNRGESRGE